MTKLGLVNRIFFQWLFVRVTRKVQDGVTIGYGLMGFVMPLSGWDNDYKIIGKRIWQL